MSGAYPCYSTYRAADGRWLAVGALEPQFWRAFCRGLGREDLSARQFDARAIADVAGAIGTRTSTAWLARFDEDACVALVRLPSEALQDDDVRGRSVSPDLDAPAPDLGADTDDLLHELGISASETRQLARGGIVAGPPSPERIARAARLGAMLLRQGSAEASPTA